MDSLKRAFGLTLMLVACSAVADDAAMIAELQEKLRNGPVSSLLFFSQEERRVERRKW